MTILQKIVSNLPSQHLKFLATKIFCKSKSIKLNSIEKYDNNFLIYNTDANFYFASEGYTWYRNYESFYQNCKNLTLKFYTPLAGDIIVDIGAGVGEEILCYSKLIGENEGKIYAIEANPTICNLLKKIIELNNIKNVIPLNLALSETNEPIEIFVDNENSYISGSLILSDNKQQSFKIDGIRLDDFIEKNSIQIINLLKVNIEGAERFLVSSLDKHFYKVKNFAISCHDFRYKEDGNEFFKTKKLIIDFLQSRGLKI